MPGMPFVLNKPALLRSQGPDPACPGRDQARQVGRRARSARVASPAFRRHSDRSTLRPPGAVGWGGGRAQDDHAAQTLESATGLFLQSASQLKGATGRTFDKDDALACQFVTVRMPSHSAFLSLLLSASCLSCFLRLSPSSPLPVSSSSPRIPRHNLAQPDTVSLDGPGSHSAARGVCRLPRTCGAACSGWRR